MKEEWVIQRSDKYYLKKRSIGTFTKNLEDAQVYNCQEDALRDIEIKFLNRSHPVLIKK